MRALTNLSLVATLVAILLQCGCTGAVAGYNSHTGFSQARISNISPNAIKVGKSSFVLVVSGANLSQESEVTWNGVAQPTTFVSSAELTAQISSQLTSTDALVSVAVMNKLSGATSNALEMTIGNPPQISTTALPAGQVGAAYVAPITVKGGVGPFRWSTTTGTMPAGLALNSSTGIISGVADASVTATVGVEVTDSLNSSAKANLPIKIGPAGGASTTLTSAGSFYGPGLGSDGLANTTIGPTGNTVSYRFMAKNSGTVEQALVYLIPDHAGYAGGNAGTTQVTFNTDDGTAAHNPSSKVLATYVMSNVLSLASPARYFYAINFATPPTVTAGHIYHLVFKSIDASPSVNFLSVDAMYEVNTSGLQGPINTNTADYSVLLGTNGSNWSPRVGYIPVYQLKFQNGLTEGMGYMEGWSGAPEPMSGTNAVRETFTVSGSGFNISSVGIRAARVNGSDPLIVRLENANGSLIEEGSIPANTIALSSSSSPSYAWLKFDFSTTYTLIPGNTYHLEFDASATSTYQTFPVRKGSSYGFQPTTFFPDGNAEVAKNGSWTGWTQWGVANRTDGDLQFYFSVAP
jgi:hypothetical protein